MHLKGTTQAEMADLFPHAPIPTMDVDTIVGLYASGLTMHRLAKYFHCRQTKIRAILQQNGVSPAALRGMRIGNTQRNVPKADIVNGELGIINNISETEWAYIAGIFDGEGNLHIDKYRNIRISIFQNGTDLHVWLYNVFGVGIIRKRPQRASSDKEQYVFIIQKQKEIYAFLIGVREFCIIKREKIEIALEIMKEKYLWPS